MTLDVKQIQTPIDISGSAQVFCFFENDIFCSLIFELCYVAIPRGAVNSSAVCDVVFPDHTHLRFF